MKKASIYDSYFANVKTYFYITLSYQKINRLLVFGETNQNYHKIFCIFPVLHFLLSDTENYFIELKQQIDTESERNRLRQELEYARGFVNAQLKKLNNERFVSGAPAEVVAKEKKKLSDGEERIKILEESLWKLNIQPPVKKGRREAKNTTGISRVEGIPYHDAWVAYKCINCKEMNYIQIGQKLLKPKEAIETAVWKCDHCEFVHSKETDLPFNNWEEDYNNAESNTALRFWEGFFRIATEHPDSYWKQCNVCTRILPFNAFSKHSGWGPLERQMECRSCKGAINAVLNPKRTKEQMHESAVRRRIADLFLEGENEQIDFQDLFDRFNSRCFKTKIPLDINNRETWAIDHILPSKYLYPLKKENAALLSRSANENKRDKWPSKFYTNNELIELAKITGANLDLISSKRPVMNHAIDVNRGVERYLQVRERSDLPKRIKEIRKIIQVYELVDNLSSENKKLLGLS